MKLTITIDVRPQSHHALLFEDVRRELTKPGALGFIDYYDPSLGDYIFANIEVDEIAELP